MRNWIGAALGLTALLTLAACGDDKKPDATSVGGVPNPLKIATEGAYPPFNSVDSSGKLVGFEVDLANEMCRRLNTQCEIVAQAWDGIIPGLNAGRYHAIMAGMSITDERKQVVAFTKGYSTTPAYFVAMNDSPLQQVDTGLERVNLTEIDGQEQAAIDALRTALKGKAVGVQVATIHANFLDTYLSDVATIRRYDTQENLALDLATGRIDVGLADAVAWGPFLASPEGQKASFVGPGFDGGLFGQGIGIALRKTDAALVEKLDAALVEMKADGTVRKLAEQWFGFDASMK